MKSFASKQNKGSEYTKRWRTKNPKKVRAWLEKNRGRINELARERRRKNPEKHKLAKRLFRERNHDRLIAEERKTRRDVIETYGGKCSCCGEDEMGFLALDHIKGGGNKHRKEVGRKMYLWAKKNNYPNILQVLCHNCNQAKHIYGECPHKKQTIN